MAEANKDEALRCLELSRNFHTQQEYELSFKYAEKSVRLYSTDMATRWLEKVRVSVQTQQTSNNFTNNSNNNGATTKTSSSTAAFNKEKGQNGSDNSVKLNYTKEQADEVKKFLKVEKNDFYAVLGLDKGCDDSKIKKAYRRLALQFHPDKNQAPGADEAFKTVSRAFSCLSDSEKKAHYDRFGAEEMVGSNAGTGGMRYRGSGGGHYGNQGGFYEAEVSPEELFNLFFGGGMSNAFGGGNGGFQFANVYVHSFNGAGFSNRQRRRGTGAAGQPSNQPTPFLAWVLQIVPFVIMALVVFFSNWTSNSAAGLNDSWDSISKHVSYEQDVSRYPNPYATQNLKIQYFGSNDFEEYFHRQRKSTGLKRELKGLEDIVERKYVTGLQAKCRAEEASLQNRRAKAKDQKELEALKTETCPSCNTLHSLGIST